MTRPGLCVLAWCAVLAVTDYARAASFACQAAATHVEHMICADPGLSRQDDALAAAYKDSRTAFEAGADGATTLLDDLTHAQQAWLASRNACADAACLGRAYASQIAVLRFQPRPGHDASADRWAGRYGYKGFMRLFVQVRDNDSVRLVITGAEPGAARWTCGFEGIGTVSGGTLQVMGPASLAAHLTRDAVQITDTAANQNTSDQSCGLNGSIIWTYAKGGLSR